MQRGNVLAELKVCGKSKNLRRGKDVHRDVIRSGLDSDAFVRSALINMYGKCGCMGEARRLFDGLSNPDVVSWNSMISGYVDNGDSRAALALLARMSLEGFVPDARSLVSALKACSCPAWKGKEDKHEKGKAIHALASALGCNSNIFVGSTLVDMYAKLESMEQARRVFDSMKQRNVVTWNALISGYAQNGEAEIALDFLSRMRSDGCLPNARTYVIALKACGTLGALEFGKQIHSRISSLEIQQDIVLATSLVDFYAKCGSVEEAKLIFDSVSKRNLETWTALMAGYSRHGDTATVFCLFDRMLDAGLKPDSITFSCILTACSHAGLVDKGKEYFESMSKLYDVQPDLEHYNTVIDLLSRANKLDESMALLRTMPFVPDAITWMTVLAACRKWKNAEIGQLAFESLMKLEDKVGGGAYVVMASIYGRRGLWENQAKVQAMRKKLRAWKNPGRSWWTSEQGKVHTFLAAEAEPGS